MSSKTKNYLFLVLVLVGATLFFLLQGGNGITPDFQEDSLTVQGPEQFSFTIFYDEIDNVELVELDDPGILHSGGENRSYYWGQWETESWGVYTLCAAKKASAAILITTVDDQRLVFNYQNDDTTRELFSMFSQLLDSRMEP